MQFLVYVIVLVITAGSVMFGAQWLPAPMTPMPAAKYELRAAKVPEKAVAPVQQANTQASQQASPQANPNVRPATAAAPAAAPAPQAASPAPDTSGALPVDTEAQSVAAAPKCDLDACGRAYRTFDPADCTYQPSGDGPRRLCTRGTPPNASPVAASSPSNARAQACNIQACSNAYISFIASDCTYQPSDGPRRLCEK